MGSYPPPSLTGYPSYYLTGYPSSYPTDYPSYYVAPPQISDPATMDVKSFNEAVDKLTATTVAIKEAEAKVKAVAAAAKEREEAAAKARDETTQKASQDQINAHLMALKRFTEAVDNLTATTVAIKEAEAKVKVEAVAEKARDEATQKTSQDQTNGHLMALKRFTEAVDKLTAATVARTEAEAKAMEEAAVAKARDEATQKAAQDQTNAHQRGFSWDRLMESDSFQKTLLHILGLTFAINLLILWGGNGRTTLDCWSRWMLLGSVSSTCGGFVLYLIHLGLTGKKKKRETFASACVLILLPFMLLSYFAALPVYQGRSEF